MSVRQRFIVAAIALSAGAVTSATITSGDTSAAPIASPAPLRIWSAGDSFAAGEGLRGIQVGEEKCQRGLGLDAGAQNPPSKAWPVLVKEGFEAATGEAFTSIGYQPWSVGAFWFTACTGATSTTFESDSTNRGTSQLAEIENAGESTTFDVITMSFGGNDIGFADIVRSCIGADLDDTSQPDALLWYALIGAPTTLSSGVGAGCGMTEAEMKSSISNGLVDNHRLTDLYDSAAAHTTAGGLIVVTGYPQLFADPSTWSNTEKAINRCNRVSEGDVRALRGATGALNQTIGEAVNQARARHPDRTWVFADVSQTFEHGGLRASLCGNLDAINGFAFNTVRSGQGDGSKTSGFARSYHPNQTGHALYGVAVIRAILQSGWTPNRVVPVDPLAGLASAPVPALCGNQAGNLVGGSLPDALLVHDPAEQSGPGVALRPDPPAVVVDLDGNGSNEIVSPVLCSYPSYSYPDGENWLLVWDQSYALLGAVQVDEYTESLTPDAGGLGVVWVSCTPDIVVCIPDQRHAGRLEISSGVAVLSESGDEPFLEEAACVSLTSMYVGMEGSRDQVALFQRTLADRGFDPGAIDGYFGSNTLQATIQESIANAPPGAFEYGVDEQTIIEPIFERLGIAC